MGKEEQIQTDKHKDKKTHMKTDNKDTQIKRRIDIKTDRKRHRDIQTYEQKDTRTDGQKEKKAIRKSHKKQIEMDKDTLDHRSAERKYIGTQTDEKKDTHKGEQKDI